MQRARYFEWKSMSQEYNSKKNKNIFNSNFTFRILAKIQSGFRPSQIAGQLGVTPQDIHYHTEKMVKADLITKGTANGIKWDLTEKGKILLKQKATGSVNSFNSKIPIRLENVSVVFKINGQVPDNDILHWTNIKNGVSKCTIRKNDHTVELVRSDKDGSVVLIHLSKQYCFNWTRKLFSLAYIALHYAKQAATQFGIRISDFGSLIKRPHTAFEKDSIALFIASSQTAEIKTREGEDGYRAWIDSSNGAGELETNDDEYAYDYLMMPKYVREIADTITIVRKQTIEYERHYHPILTRNN
jgi:DNA-binding MarR family transcriptional regulator